MVKCCNEHVSVCLSANISPEPHTRSLPNFLYILPIAAARSSGEVTQSKEEGAIFRVFFPIVNALYSIIAFGTFTKTADPIKMLFSFMTWVGLVYVNVC